MAELLGAQGKLDDAASIYEDVVTRVPKPELQQALGELYNEAGHTDKAEEWFGKAHSAYLDSVEQGEVHYYHHLADFYVDVREDGPEAVKWARKDFALRKNYATQAALAWALYRNRQFDEAMVTMSQALASGVQDARMFHQAGMIHLSAGREKEGEQLIRKASEINAHHNCFHVHR